MNLTAAAVLDLVPQRRPMRFIDEILELDEEHILGAYTWKTEDCAGSVPNGQIVPNFKIIEMAAQIGNVAWCIYHLALERTPKEIEGLVGLMTELRSGSCRTLARAGDRVACWADFGEEGFFRAGKLVCRVELRIEGGPRSGLEVFSGVIAGMFVPKTAA